jgi:DNA-binding LytR/AlgR family response regulator
MRPKLALVDINLEGGYEGLALAHELQALYGTKIVFVTGYHVRDLMHRMNGADNMAVLFKPVDREVLRAVLAKVSATLAGAH